MPNEIERKFLVNGEDYKITTDFKHITQGFLSTHPARVVRIRIADENALLTIKSKIKGATRLEFEYQIPYNDAKELIKLCRQPVIEKTRYIHKIGNHTWEVDEFRGENKGLVIAEVELKNEKEPINLPEWIGQEVTSNKKYYNNYLALNPYTRWNSAK